MMMILRFFSILLLCSFSLVLSDLFEYDVGCNSQCDSGSSGRAYYLWEHDSGTGVINDFTLWVGDTLSFLIDTSSSANFHNLIICNNSIVTSQCYQASSRSSDVLAGTATGTKGQNAEYTFLRTGTYYWGCNGHGKLTTQYAHFLFPTATFLLTRFYYIINYLIIVQ
jgi:hypothetical protein